MATAPSGCIYLLAQELRDMGIDADCAPVLDIARADTHPFLKNRCLGSDAGTVTRLGRIAAEATGRRRPAHRQAHARPGRARRQPQGTCRWSMRWPS